MTELSYRQSENGKDLPSSRPSNASGPSFRTIIWTYQVDACMMPPHQQARTSKWMKRKGDLVNGGRKRNEVLHDGTEDNPEV